MNKVYKCGEVYATTCDYEKDADGFARAYEWVTTWAKQFGPALPHPFIYADPPWNAGVLSMFRKMVGEPPRMKFDAFLSRIVDVLYSVPADVVFCEMGRQAKVDFTSRMEAAGSLRLVKGYEVSYGRGKANKPSWLGMFSPSRESDGTPEIAQGLIDEAIPLICIDWYMSTLRLPFVIDPFCGLGVTLDAAAKRGVPALGVDLVPARVEKAMHHVSKILRRPIEAIGEV